MNDLNWKLDILRLLNGQNALDVAYLGSAAAFVESRILTTEDELISRMAVQEAIDEILREIEIADLSDYAIDQLLTLIGEYVPKNGVPKLLAYALSGGGFNSSATFIGDPTPTDLHLKFLYIIRKNFNIAPSDYSTNPVFRAYKTVLFQHLLSNSYVTFVSKELARLGAIEPGTTEGLQLIQFDPKIIYGLVEHFVAPATRRESPGAIKNLAIDASNASAQAHDIFYTCIQNFGTFEYPDIEPPYSDLLQEPLPLAIVFSPNDRLEFGWKPEEIILFESRSKELSREMSLHTALLEKKFEPAQLSLFISMRFNDHVASGDAAIETFYNEVATVGANLNIHRNEAYFIHRKTNQMIKLSSPPNLIIRFVEWEIRKSNNAERLHEIMVQANA